MTDTTPQAQPTAPAPRLPRPGSRAATFSVKRTSKRELRRLSALHPYPEDVVRPRTRGDCESGGVNAQRPCPFVSCKYHLYIDVRSDTGSIKVNFPDSDVDELAETCALDVAARGGVSLEEVGQLMNLTRERARQYEAMGAIKLKPHAWRDGERELQWRLPAIPDPRPERAQVDYFGEGGGVLVHRPPAPRAESFEPSSYLHAALFHVFYRRYTCPNCRSRFTWRRSRGAAPVLCGRCRGEPDV